MKTFFCFVFFLVSVTFVNTRPSKEYTNKFKAAVQKCSQQFNLTLDVEGYAKYRKLSETKNGKCAVLCVFKEMEYVTDGKLNFEHVVSSSKHKWEGSAVIEKAKNVYSTCYKELNLENDTFDCDKAVEMLGCLMKGSKEHSIPAPYLS
ncbi:uncharacterized protein LOC106665306 isoform X2 [Cimex lectularius]|uniref:Odorant binding protein n=1 Tax=Cimex lectularius TaxID=79782 RepID=A0A8I6TDK6_CIMLE|nr:uncharacterized protein LOC106665306 isoform X2 [Cimex lectularius]